MIGFSDSDAAAFRQATEAAIAYRQGVGSRPIGPAADYGRMLAAFDAPLPEKGVPVEEVLRDLTERGMDGTMDMISPRFFGWVIGAAHPAGTALDMLSSGWSQVATMAVTTPTFSALEEITGRWLLDLLNLPPDCSVGVTTGATVANTIGLAAGRNEVLRRQGWDVEADGLIGAPPITVVVGAEVHSSVRMSLRILGLGATRVLTVEADGEGRMKADALADSLVDIDGPILIAAQAGNINSGALDPVGDIADIAAGKGAWLHVDGAFGLWAAAHPDLQDQAIGMERADSWAVDGHKWLQVPYDCGFVFCRDAAAHYRAMGHSAAYLPNSDTHRDPGDYVTELSRRSRALPVWGILRALGRDGVLEMLARSCRNARNLAGRLAQLPYAEVLNDVRLNQVAVAFGPKGDIGDRQTRAVLARLQERGVIYPSHGQWKGRETIRFSFSGWATDDDDVTLAMREVTEAWEAVGEAAA